MLASAAAGWPTAGGQQIPLSSPSGAANPDVSAACPALKL